MRSTREILAEDFNIDSPTDIYEADLIEAGKAALHQDLMDVAAALDSALRYIKGAPIAVRNQVGEALTQTERNLTEIEG